MQPTYFTKHPDGSYSEARPQPILLPAAAPGGCEAYAELIAELEGPTIDKSRIDLQNLMWKAADAIKGASAPDTAWNQRVTITSQQAGERTYAEGLEDAAKYFEREGKGRFEVDGNWLAKTIRSLTQSAAREGKAS